MDAAFRGDADRVRALLKAGADANVVSGTAHRHRPLHRAIEQKKTHQRGEPHAEVVRALLAGGADPKLRGTYARLTALQLAATGEFRFVPLLRPYFDELDIFHAAATGDADRAEQLLKRDKSVANALDANGWRPLHYCCASAAYKFGPEQSAALVRIARLLIRQGADPKATWRFDNKWPLTAMYHCTGQQDNAALAEVLFDAGALPYDGESVFHAADEEHTASLTVFERRCDRELLAAECTRALRTLMHWGRVRGVPWLLAHGADPNAIHKESGDSALHSAVKQRNNDRTIKLLLKHGADPRGKNKSGKTAIDLARESTASARILPLLKTKQ